MRLVARHTDLTLAEIRQALAAAGISVGRSTGWRFVTMHKLPLKSPDLKPIEPGFCRGVGHE